MSEANEYIEAVTVIATAKAADMLSQTLRARVKNGRIPGCFKEHRWIGDGNNRNARWFIPIDIARRIVTEEGGDPDALSQVTEKIRPYPESIIQPKEPT